MAAIEVKVPDIGDFKDVPIIEILVKSGDAVTAEQPLLTLESDKATLEVPAPAAGVIGKIVAILALLPPWILLYLVSGSKGMWSQRRRRRRKRKPRRRLRPRLRPPRLRRPPNPSGLLRRGPRLSRSTSPASSPARRRGGSRANSTST